MPLHPRVRTALTLGVLLVVVLLALAWGTAQLTAPLPGIGADDSICESSDVAEGAVLRPPQIVVSVYNAGDRNGLANRVLTELEKRGFAAGRVGNAPGTIRVRATQVWASDPTGPAARLVAGQFGAGTPVREPTIASYADQGIVVIVGDRSALATGPTTVRATAPSSVCGPVG